MTMADPCNRVAEKEGIEGKGDTQLLSATKSLYLDSGCNDFCNFVINTALVTMTFVVTDCMCATPAHSLTVMVSCSLYQVIFRRLLEDTDMCIVFIKARNIIGGIYPDVTGDISFHCRRLLPISRT